jgi:hypothetical protein
MIARSRWRDNGNPGRERRMGWQQFRERGCGVAGVPALAGLGGEDRLKAGLQQLPAGSRRAARLMATRPSEENP